MKDAERSKVLLTSGESLRRTRTSRSGGIPYCVLTSTSTTTSSGAGRDKIAFLLSVHGPSKQLGDFAGGVKKYEHALGAGVREFTEETRGIFSRFPWSGTKGVRGTYSTEEDFYSSIAFINDGDMATMFIKVDPEWYNIARQEFLSSTACSSVSNEITDVVWVSEEEFTNLVFDDHLPVSPPRRADDKNFENQNIMWNRVKIFLQKSLRSRTNFYNLLLSHRPIGTIRNDDTGDQSDSVSN